MSAKIRAMVIENLEKCCEEIVNWKKTGVLVEGRVREIAKTCCDDEFSLRRVEDCVAEEAMKHVVYHLERYEEL